MLVVSIGNTPVVSGSSVSESLVTGPYIDEVIFKVIYDRDERLLALQSGDIEIDTSSYGNEYLSTLESDPDISVVQTRSNGYKQLTINCAKYPLNISGFRRAFAFAYNKTKATTELQYGFGIEHDSVVSQYNGWCIEDQFDWSYYSAQPDIGNQLLDYLNFTIDTVTGYRLAPNGEPFCITIEYPANLSGEILRQVAQIGVDALNSLHINAEIHASDFNEFVSRLISHCEFDMIAFSKYFDTNDVDWLAYDYWSECATVEGENPSNFVNETYDSWRNQLLYSTSYEAVYEAAAEMQKILHYNVPILVVYESTNTHAYRNDKYTGHVEDMGRYSSYPWTLRNIHKIDGSFGGSVPVAISWGPGDFNIFSFMSAYYYNEILDNIWSSLYKYGPDLNPVPDLAKNMAIETHSDNSAVPEGHTRFTMDIVRNATWSDGVPLTADDVAFSFVYAKESQQYGYPAGSLAADLVAAYAPTHDRVVLEYNSESYWHFSDFAFRYVIPVHIFNNSGGIGYDGWGAWNPVYNETHPHVNCGPFIITDFERNEYYKMERNPQFHYAITPYTTTTTITSTTTTTNQTTSHETYWPIVITTALISGSGIVAIFYVVVRIQNRKS